jgi:hypothetical protein
VHTSTEAVLLGAAAVVGLERALAHEDHSGWAGSPECSDRGHRYMGDSHRKAQVNRPRIRRDLRDPKLRHRPAIIHRPRNRAGDDTRAGSTVEFAPETPAD